jgi:predicted TIM-barrel fold metal-dependent hydrolase
MELVAMALHKTNVYIDISGWSPKRIPAELVREMRGRLSEQFLWGSDFPFITPERCLIELESLDVPEPAFSRVLHGNAARILGLDGADPGERPPWNPPMAPGPVPPSRDLDQG